MGQEIALTKPQNLKLFEPKLFDLDQITETTQTPNLWFGQRYPEQFDRFGSPFLELTEPLDKFSAQVLPISINIDFFAAMLGGRRDLGHHVIYFEPEMSWYFLDNDGVYKPTTAEKLMNQYRALMMKCNQDMPAQVHKLNLFHEFRSDKTAKAIVQRAKSILAADSSFFSVTSPHQRIRGIELHERIARKFVDDLLTCEPGQTLLLTDAYATFCNLIKQQSLEPVKRSEFKAMVVPLIKDQFNVALRNDLKIDDRQGVRGWKDVRIVSQTRPG